MPGSLHRLAGVRIHGYKKAILLVLIQWRPRVARTLCSRSVRDRSTEAPFTHCRSGASTQDAADDLFTKSGDNSEQAQTVDDALYALRALSNCLELRTRELKAAYEHSVLVTGNERLSVPCRFVRICGCRSRPERCPEDTHKEHRDRVIWLSRPTSITIYAGSRRRSGTRRIG